MKATAISAVASPTTQREVASLARAEGALGVERALVVQEQVVQAAQTA